MSSATKGRKSRQARPSAKSKTNVFSQNQPYDGAYANPQLVHVLLSLMGKKCQTNLRNQGVYEGIFHTFNPKMDVVLNVVHKRTKSDDSVASTNGSDSLSSDNDCPKEEELVERVIFQTEKIVSVTFEDVDMSFAELEINETNGDTSSQSRPYSKSSEKKLEPWNGMGDGLEEKECIGGLEDMKSEGTNGWGADEMFRANEEKYGVKSDYDSSLAHYTMPLDIKDTDEDSERVARATKLAQEIESNTDSRQRIDLELDDGVTEEDKFSAVVRERDRREPRESRDYRDRERDPRDFRDREKDRGDVRDRDKDPLSPPGTRSKHEYDRFHNPNRNRGRGRDRGQQGYSNLGMPQSRSMGQGGPSGGRSQQSQMDSQSSQNMMGKFRSGQAIAPRFTRSGSGGHSNSMQREDERMRHHGDNFGKNPKQNRIPTRSKGPWNQEYPPHGGSSSQMHQDPGNLHMASGLGGQQPLSRTPSSTSSGPTPTQGYRKQSSGHEDQPQLGQPQVHHQHARQPSSPTGGPMPNTNQPAMPRIQQIQPQIGTSGASVTMKDASWSAIVSGNPNLATVPRGEVKYIYTPRIPQNIPRQKYPSSMIGVSPNMGSPRSQPHMNPMPEQMMMRPPLAQQPGVVTSPPQQQPQQNMPPSPHQQIASPQIGPRSMKPQPSQKVPDNVRQDPARHVGDKHEDNKVPLKKHEPPAPTPHSSSGSKRNEIEGLKKFGEHFKLKSDNEEPPLSTPNTAAMGQQPHSQRFSARPQANMAQTSNTRGHSYPTSTVQQQQQQAYQQPQPPQPYPVGIAHEHSAAQAHPGASSLTLTQVPINPQQGKQMISPPPRQPMQTQKQMGTQQMPLAPAHIHDFSGQPQVPQSSPRMQEGSQQHNRKPNVHVVTSQARPQANPPAVNTVSAAVASPIVTGHHPPVPSSTAMAPVQRQSPTVATGGQGPTPQPIENKPAPVPTTPTGNVSAVTSPTGAPKALNPEAPLFTPRTPAKPSPSATTPRTPTPQSQIPIYQQQPTVQGFSAVQPMPGAMGLQTQGAVTPVYPQGQVAQAIPVEQSIMPAMHYQPIQQQFFLQHHPSHPVAQQMPGQQMQGYPYEQGQVYAQAPQPAMMHQNVPRVAMPNAGPQAMQQYPPEQAAPHGTAMYVATTPIAPQGGIQTNFMQRPHSAHTPTQPPHVTAASPANPAAQQGHAPGVPQTQVWVQANHQGYMIQHAANMGQPPAAPSAYLSMGHIPTTMAIAGGTAQQKGQTQAIAAAQMITQQNSRQFPSQYPGSPTNQ